MQFGLLEYGVQYLISYGGQTGENGFRENLEKCCFVLTEIFEDLQKLWEFMGTLYSSSLRAGSPAYPSPRPR